LNSRLRERLWTWLAFRVADTRRVGPLWSTFPTSPNTWTAPTSSSNEMTSSV
jgi:hypothetical protein